MDFELTDEQQQIRDTLTDFADREIKPHSSAWDKDDTFPRHVVEQLGELGFLGVAFPEKYGGGGADTLSQVLVVEGISRYDAGVGLSCAAHMSLSSGHIGMFASEAIKRALPARYALGEEDRGVVPHRAGAPVPTRPRCAPRRCGPAITIASTARRCSSPTAPSPTFTS
jgi:alkylation response protein AidB-like acyl-CoA dehydrogenase